MKKWFRKQLCKWFHLVTAEQFDAFSAKYKTLKQERFNLETACHEVREILITTVRQNNHE